VAPPSKSFLPSLPPPLEKRRDEWIQSIAEGLLNLEREFETFKAESLSQNEVFITTLAQASNAAIRNHQPDKISALRNAVLNSALPNPPEEDLQLMFLNFVDSFTPWHLRLLKFFDDPARWAEENKIQYPPWSAGAPSKVLEFVFEELHGKREFYDQLVKDLFARGLMNADSLHAMMTAQGMTASRTTKIGKEFLDFITSPELKTPSK
jgi:hypothetical protein